MNDSLLVIFSQALKLARHVSTFVLFLFLSHTTFSQNCTVNAGSNLLVCGSSSTLTGSVTGVFGPGTPMWTYVSGPGPIPVIASPASLVTSVSGMSADGVYVFQLSKTCGTGVSTDQVSITAHPVPVGFTAGADITGICATVGTTPLSGVIPAGYTGNWRAENIYNLLRFGPPAISTNSAFSSTTVANPTFSLVSTSDHTIDPAYYDILTITTMDGMCSYSDTTIVRFCPNPVLIPDPDLTYDYCGLGTVYIDLDDASPDMSSDPAYSGAGSTSIVTYTVNTVSKPGGAGALTFASIDGDRVYMTGFDVVGVYVFSVTVSSPCCGMPATTSNITLTVSPTAPSSLNFQPLGHPEQMSLFYYGGTAGEVHCGVAGTSTPELFYFDINAADLPSTVTVVTSSGILPTGASAPIITSLGAGTMNRSVSVDPGASGWKIGTYKFSVSTGIFPCASVSTYYIHISDGSRTAVSFPDVSICYPGTTTSISVTQPAPFKGVSDPSYLQDFFGFWDYSVISKPAGAGTPIYSNAGIDQLTATISNLTLPGDYVFQVTANNGGWWVGDFLEAEYACSGITGSLTTTFTVHVENMITANAGSNQSLPCTSYIYLLGNNPGTGIGTWSNVSNPGSLPTIAAPNSVNCIPTDLNVAGAYTFNWNITSQYGSCTSNDPITFTISAVSPAAPLLGAIIQPSCSVATGSVNFSGLPAGAWVLTATNSLAVATSISGSGATAIYSGLVPETYTFAVFDGICNSFQSAPVTITPQPYVPTAPAIGTITQPTCSVATGSVDLSGLPNSGAWTVTANPGGSTITGSGPVTTGVFSGLTDNSTYTFTVTASSGCTSSSSSNAVINMQPSIPTAPVIGLISQPTCSVVTGSIDLTGLPNFGAWTVTESPGGSTITGAGPVTTGTFSGLANNTSYTFTVTNASGCTSVSSLNAVINLQPSTPSAPAIGTITQPTCSVATGSVDLSGLPNSGVWTVTANPGGATISGSAPATVATFSGLTANTTYTFSITNASGCTSFSSSNVVINNQPATPDAPIIGAITQPTCTVATGSVDISGLPNSGAWTVTATPGGLVMSGSGPATTGVFGSLTENTTYTFSVTDALGCISAGSLNAVIDMQPLTPTAPLVGSITQPTCSVATGSVDLSGLPNSGAWTVTATPGGSTVTGSGPVTTGVFSGLTENTTYTFTVMNASGCVSVSSLNAVISAQPSTPSAPVVGAITQPTCSMATGSVDLSGLPNSGTWTVTAAPGGSTISGSGPVTTGSFSGLAENMTYTFTVTNSSGCVSAVSTNAVIDAQPLTPAAPIAGTITQPTCITATGSVDLSGLPNSGAWMVTATPGSSTITGSGPVTTATFSGLTENTTYTFTVTDGSGCLSPSSSNVVINAQPVASQLTFTAIDPSTCGGDDGQIIISGLNPNSYYDLNYYKDVITLLSSTGVMSGSSGEIVLSDLEAAQYDNFTLEIGGCVSTGSGALLVSPPSPVIDAILPVVVCDSFVLDVITGTDLTGSEAYYTGVSGTGIQFNSGDVISDSFSILYAYDINGTCSSEESFSITVNPTDDSGFTLSDYCVGTFNQAVITGEPGGTFSFNTILSDGAAINSAEGSISNGVAGTTYSVVYTTNGACPSSSIQTVTVNSSSAVPDVTSNATYCSTELPSGIHASPTMGGTVTWYLDNSLTNVIGVGDSIQPNSITWTYYVTETVNGCEGAASAVTITVQDCEIIIPTAFTPDNDGTNDKWELINLDEIYPNNEVTIYNRWGGLVFKSSKGQYSVNSWDGTFKGKVLPVESFYFIIEYNDDVKVPSKGTVSIILE